MSVDRLTGIHFEHPLLLLALPPAVLAILVLARARVRAMPAGQRAATLALRSLIVTLLILALAEPTFGILRPFRNVVFAIDVSESVSQQQRDWTRAWVRQAIQELGPNSRVAVIEFGQWAQLAGSGSALPSGGETNLEQAITLARSALSSPESSAGEIVLLTDGWQTAGDAPRAMRRAAAGGVTVSYVPISLAGQQPPEVTVASLDVPPFARAGDLVDVAAVLHSTGQIAATLRVSLDDQVVSEQQVTLRPGINRVPVALRLPATGFHDILAAVVPAQDTRADNNSLVTSTVVKEPGRVLVLEHEPGQASRLVEILRADGLDVQVQPSSQIPPTTEPLTGYDAAVLVDTPATSLTLDQQKTLQLFVRELGRGLVVIGGQRSFGPGGYEGSTLDEMLPVSSRPPERPERSSVALFLVLDKSGSMASAWSNEASKLAMAREAAIQAVGLLQPGDVIGIVAFDSEYQWLVPTTRIENADTIRSIQDRISGLESGGGTSILPPLQAAYEAASRVDARLKHIVLLTDGQSSDRGYEALLRRMEQYQITLSTVAIGSDADTELLARLAELGGGRYHFTERSTQVPRIATQETSILIRSAVVESEVTAQPAASSPLLRSLPGELPTLNGYIATTPRQRAVTALETSQGDPLLAHWQYGLGRVVAWTSDASPAGWSSRWLDSGWPNAGLFWSQVVRWSMPAPVRPDFLVSAQPEPGGHRVLLRVESLREDGTFANGLDTRATIALPDGSAREVALPQRAPGVYEQTLAVEHPGTYRVLFSQRAGDQVIKEELATFSVPVPGFEGRTAGVNLVLLRQLAEGTGGRELRLPADLVASPPVARLEERLALWPWLLGAAALLFPLDVAARRLSWPARRVTTGSRSATLAGTAVPAPERERVGIHGDE
ncbi:VWA domain-containing protein [Thermomicrobiaceae bacterium CFH 74404]|uniref:VWA domain-containing protein n=1 Tax=Thermalbibacter longus TaxID=2951981 RepID=A0AA42B942_9BACT|nr:VWA domain-containing protein [Thermalbibacter longus]MCM8747587.1 VWA domain-containing protein [Thermalbibacter longus]